MLCIFHVTMSFIIATWLKKKSVTFKPCNVCPQMWSFSDHMVDFITFFGTEFHISYVFYLLPANNSIQSNLQITLMCSL